MAEALEKWPIDLFQKLLPRVYQIVDEINRRFVLNQIEFAADIKGERLACLEARSQFCWYLRGVPHANVYKQEVVHVETLNDLRRITHAIQRDLRD